MSKFNYIIVYVTTNKQSCLPQSKITKLYHAIQLKHGIYVGGPWAMAHT